jgi:hypothetical protein
MARQYSPTQFFRHAPNALLARHFQEKHCVLQEIDFGKLKESEAEPIFQAFTALPPDTQAKIEAECQDIDAMACQGGITALTDNAMKHGVLSRHVVLPHENRDEYEALPLALVMEHQPGGPTELHLVEELASIIWRKRRVILAEGARIHEGLRNAASTPTLEPICFRMEREARFTPAIKAQTFQAIWA